ncbi:hypothetical protein [Metallosphaera sp.]|uniref:hypothetical protein n=1 Tax=Metallosphaera sp. TaxID=2020860 RepID=UPI003168516D
MLSSLNELPPAVPAEILLPLPHPALLNQMVLVAGRAGYVPVNKFSFHFYVCPTIYFSLQISNRL